MNLLNSKKTAEKIIELSNQHKNIAFAVAWASYDNSVFKCFQASSDKIKYAVIGTHFCQTHWRVLDWSKKNDANIGFIFDDKSNSVFHPKIYVFWSGKDWDVLVGSANLTVGGMDNNTELMLHISNRDINNNYLFEQSLKEIECYWDLSDWVTAHKLSRYREQWEKAREKMNKMKPFHRTDSGVFSWTWEKYCENFLTPEGEVKSDGINAALQLLKKARSKFDSGKSFNEFDSNTRRALAGSHPPKEGEWKDDDDIGYFGFTRAYGFRTIC